MREHKPGAGRSSIAGGNGGDTALAPGRRPLVQAKRIDGAVVQRRVEAQAAAPAAPAAAVSSGGGSPLPEGTRAQMESSFGADFSSVRVHQDDSAAAMGAQAYARGSDVHFAAGQYDPDSRVGMELIGHELAHVVQQSEGRVAATTQAKGVALNDDAGLEHEADEMGARAAQGLPARDGAAPVVALADGPVQCQIAPYQETGDAVDKMKEIAAHLDDCVSKAVAIVAATPTLHGVPNNDTGYLGAWVTTYNAYVANPNVVPQFFFARYGYAIETLAMAMVGASYGKYLLQQQVAHGHTRPDLVVYDGTTKQEVAWLDITSAGSVGHVLKKQHSGWSSRPYVAEIVYAMPSPSALAANSGTLSDDQKAALAKADADAGARAAAFEAGVEDLGVAIAEALLSAYQAKGAPLAAGESQRVAKQACEDLTKTAVTARTAVGVVSLVDFLNIAGTTDTGESWARWMPDKPDMPKARALAQAWGAHKLGKKEDAASSSGDVEMS